MSRHLEIVKRCANMTTALHTHIHPHKTTCGVDTYMRIYVLSCIYNFKPFLGIGCYSVYSPIRLAHLWHNLCLRGFINYYFVCSHRGVGSILHSLDIFKFYCPMILIAIICIWEFVWSRGRCLHWWRGQQPNRSVLGYILLFDQAEAPQIQNLADILLIFVSESWIKTDYNNLEKFWSRLKEKEALVELTW